MGHLEHFIFLTIITFLLINDCLAKSKHQQRLDDRCVVSHNLTGSNAIGRCDNDRLLCSCRCPPPSKQFEDACCPPYSIQQMEDISLVKEVSLGSLNKTCIFFREFDCYRNITESCKKSQIIVANMKNCFSNFKRHVRSFFLHEKCFVIRKTLESLCPQTQNEHVLTTSENIDNTITMVSESFECHCDVPIPITTTVKPRPDPIPNDDFKYIYLVIASGTVIMLLVAILFAVVCKRKRHESILDDSSDRLIPHSPLDSYPFWKSPQPLRPLSLRPIGRGRFGEVYKAEQTLLKKIVAIKRIPIHNVNSDMNQFLREIRHLVQIENNDHVVKLLDCWVENPQGNVETDDNWLVDTNHDLDYVLFLQMEFCDSDLDQVLRSHKTFKSRENFINFKDLVRHLVTGLKAIHNSGIIHRDIKPGNVLYTQIDQAGGKCWKIGDLGLSREIFANGEPLSMAGTVGYMSPEMKEGTYTEGTDVFSLGLTILESFCPSLLDNTEKKKTFDTIASASSNERNQYLGTLLNHLPSNLAIEQTVLRQMLETDLSLRVNASQIYDELCT